MQTVPSALRAQICKRLYSHAAAHAAAGFRVIRDGHVDVTTKTYRERYAANQQLNDTVRKLQACASDGGGERAVQRHRQSNKLLVRERFRLLCDADSPFVEIGSIVGHDDDLPGAGAGVLAGVCVVGGRHVVVCGHDSTVKSGSIYPMSLSKQMRMQYLSAALRLPSILLMDSSGAYLPLQAEIFNRGGRTFYNEAMLGAQGLPQLSVVMGACVAGGAYGPTMTDNAVMVDRIGTLFLGGPHLVRAATGEIITAEELGGATTHCRVSGTTDYFARNEHEALVHVRDLMSTVRASEERLVHLSWQESDATRPLYSSTDLAGLAGDTVDTGDKTFAYQLLARLADRSELCEFRTMYADALVCGWIRLAGAVVGVVCATGRPITRSSAESACQLVQMCSEARIPLLVVQRCVHDGWTAYTSDDIKAHAQLLSALAVTDSHKLVINAGDAFGADYLLTCARSFDPTYYFSWPNARIAMHACDSSATDTLQAPAALVTDDVVLPHHTRRLLIDCIKTLPKQQQASALCDQMLMLKM